MVYISSWQEFQEAAEALYEKSPNTVCFISESVWFNLIILSDKILRKMEGVRG